MARSWYEKKYRPLHWCQARRGGKRFWFCGSKVPKSGRKKKWVRCVFSLACSSFSARDVGTENSRPSHFSVIQSAKILFITKLKSFKIIISFSLNFKALKSPNTLKWKDYSICWFNFFRLPVTAIIIIIMLIQLNFFILPCIIWHAQQLSLFKDKENGKSMWHS